MNKVCWRGDPGARPRALRGCPKLRLKGSKAQRLKGKAQQVGDGGPTLGPETVSPFPATAFRFPFLLRTFLLQFPHTLPAFFFLFPRFREL